MVKLSYGSQNQVSFPNFTEYYISLGFIANSKHAEIRWENNEDQGAWGSEGRIHCLVPANRFPQHFRFTAGRGNVYARINCNEYVATLVRDHNFRYNTKRQDVEAILKTVPEQYRQAFQDGYGSKIQYNPPYQTPKSSSVNSTKPTPKISTSSTLVIQPVVRTVPEVKKIDISVGDRVIHKTFGPGTVYEVDGDYVRVDFPNHGKKSFVNPQSFTNGFISKES